MKSFILPAVFAASMCISCTKTLNPKPSRHSDCEFSLQVAESRQSRNFIWKISSTGELSCENQDLQELWVSNYNKCLLRASSDDNAFNGVNFSSSDPGTVSVEKIDECTCRLLYRSDSPEGGSVTITASSGNEHQLSFQVRSMSCIPLKGIMLHLGELDISVPLSYYRDKIYPDDPAYIWFEKTVDYSSYPGDTLVAGHLIPENASFRKVESLKFFCESDCFAEIADRQDFDWSEIEGKRAFYKPDASGITFHAVFDIAGNKRSCAMIGRYKFPAMDVLN